MKKVAIIGSTGYVGQKALDVIDHFKEQLQVFALVCKTNVELLKSQSIKFSPKYIFIEEKYQKEFSNVLSIEEIVTHQDVDIVLFAMDGVEAIKPAFLSALAGKEIALANKEILACAGESFMKLCREKNVTIYPVDNEHSAIEQCLAGEKIKEVEKVILTASGGPFFQDFLAENFLAEKAAIHPTYKCSKVTAINCSTLMNKGLEIIEAKHLFNLDADKIDVIIHPQSIVQSLICFKDGAVKALFGEPEVTQPLQYAFLNRERKKGSIPLFDFTKNNQLTFFPKDLERFRCLKLAFYALKEGGAKGAYLNAANEVLVERFCQGRVSWKQIGENLEDLMNKNDISSDASLESILDTDKNARAHARRILN
jgi:1-deoxy-D-xylulose-5-phosphate reductoisomerase